VKKVESTADMIIISPPTRRAAMAELLAMYFSAMTRLQRLAYHFPDSFIWNKYQAAYRYLFYKLAR